MAVDKLSTTRCRTLKNGKHSDGRGLYLFVRGDSRIWTLRYTDPDTGKRGEKSLGVYPEVTLGEARKRRDTARLGPKTSRDQTLRAWVGRWLKANRHDLKDSGRAGRWLSPLKVHVLPTLGQRDVRQLTLDNIKGVFDPIWRVKTSASLKALNRLGIVLRFAEAELPEVDVRLVPRVRTGLGKQRHQVQHIPAMPWTDVPGFYASLGETPTELAMRLLILTAARSTPIRLAREEHFDGEVWHIPAPLMKNSQPFRIPLSEEALRVIDLARPLARDGYLFCAVRGRPISDMAMNKHLARRGLKYRPHGFRSSFRMWAEEARQDWTLAEMSLAHTIGGKVERSYQRADLLDQRRGVMDRWADVVTGSESCA